MDIAKSVYSLIKNNNGFFKSEKQAAFLSSILQQFDGHIGHTNSGYNSCPVFAECDKQGIVKVYKTTKLGDVVIFERPTAGKLTALQAKELKYYERKAKELEKIIKKAAADFASGAYNSSGDPSTYPPQTIALYHKSRAKDIEMLAAFKAKISSIKKSLF